MTIELSKDLPVELILSKRARVEVKGSGRHGQFHWVWQPEVLEEGI